MGLENQMKVLNGKKLLILGGANLHCDLVIAAKNLGVETFVTDYLPIDKAPAKQLADHFWDYEGVLQKFFNLDVFSAMTIFAIKGLASLLRESGGVR